MRIKSRSQNKNRIKNSESILHTQPPIFPDQHIGDLNVKHLSRRNAELMPQRVSVIATVEPRFDDGPAAICEFGLDNHNG